MDDFMLTGRLDGLKVAFGFAAVTHVANHVVLNHDCDPLTAHLLGRAMATGFLCSDVLGKSERLNLRWRYKGALRTVLVDVGDDGTARGLISPTELRDPPEDVQAIFGEGGEIGVIRSRHGEVLNSGTVPAVFNNIVEDLAYFLCMSDQVETAMRVMIGFNRDVTNPVTLCQGIKLHALPETDLEQFDALRRALQSEEIRRRMVEPVKNEDDLRDLLQRVISGHGESSITTNRGPRPRFHCNCGPDKMGPVLRALPYNERMEMVKEDKDVVIRCQFCNTQYTLSVEECIRAWNNQPIERHADGFS